MLTEIQTNEQIWNAANEEWVGILSRLWVAYDKPLDSERLTIYRNMLEKVPMGLLDLAVNRVIREHQYNSVPSVGDVWKAVRKELSIRFNREVTKDLDDMIEQWKEIIPFGIYRFETGKWE